jgi:uroporphyrinogen III methyltransferase/synthase
LQEAGADVITLPLLEILPPSSWERLDGAIQEISSFDWLVLTSANGVKFFMERLHDLGKDIRILNNIKIAVVGKKTADYLKKFYLKPNFIPSDFIADSLVENFPEDINGKKILFPRVETGGRDILLKEFIKKGASITEVPAYQSICPKNIDNEIWKILKNEQVDIITFTSSKIVKHFYHLFKNIFPDSIEEKKILSKLDNVYLACIGPQTSKTCNDLFGRVDVEAKEYTLEGLTNQLIDYFS